MNAFDLWLLGALNAWAGKNEWLDAAIIFFAVWLGWWMVAGVIAFIVAPLVRKTGLPAEQAKKAFVIFGSALIARYGIVGAMRFFYDRPRPFEILADAYQLIQHSAGGSFPSGHAAFFFALTTGVFFYNRRIGTIFFAGALLVSIGRAIAGVHWPSDILAGAAVGILTPWIVYKVFTKTSRS